MFELQSYPFRIKQIQTNVEHHGEEQHTLYVMKCYTVVENHDLIEFHSELRQMLFKKSDDPDLAEEGREDDLTEIRFPLIKNIKWDKEFVGYEAAIEWGIAAKIKLSDCRLKGFVFEPMPKGMVRIDFNMIAKVPEKNVGKLCDMVKKEVLIDLTPPKEDDRQSRLDR